MHAVRERVEKLEFLLSDRNAVDVLQESTSVSTPVFNENPFPLPGGGGSSTGSTPLRKIKIKNCE